MAESLPKRIGPWRIEAEIGRGMMGVVYKGRDARRRVAAVKVVRIVFPVSDEDRLRFETRFIQEGRIVARLSHEGIVGVYDVGRDKRSRVPYMALEYLEGRTLAAFLTEGPALPWREALAIVAQVARALHYAHGQRVIHRDIKPANVMVLPSGRAKLMDFGLAKHEAGVELTSTGQFMGTPLYMSPEQALGEKVDSRTDLFSLGSVAYTLLTGRRAFEADSVPQVMNRVAQATPRAPTQVSPTLPPAVDYVIARSMAKRRADRYAAGRMFAEDLEDVLEDRTPRHSAGWTRPAAGEGTLVSTRDPRHEADDGSEVELEPVEEGPHRGVGALLGLGLLLVALITIVARSPFWQQRIAEALTPTPAPGPRVTASLPAAPTPPPTTLPSPEASASPEPSPGSEPVTRPASGEVPVMASAEDDILVDETPLGTSDSPEPAPATTAPHPAEEPLATATLPSPSPVTPSEGAADLVVASPSAGPTPRAPAPPAKLSISFEHGIENGTLRILVDRKAVLQHRLTSRVTRDLLLFKLRSGVVRDTLPVAPGKRRIRVEVKTGDEVRTKETVASFRAGVTRRLEVKIGRLRGNLSLAWE
jgi:serine/threonine-protein kinase